MPQKVLILGGSGKIGSHAAEAFWNAGWTVRQFDRAKDDMTTAAMGCDVIVNGLNPTGYRNWAQAIPAITAQVIAAAKASGATVIIPGNICVYGDQPGVLDENTPHLATTRKGKIRIDMEAAYRASGVRTIVLRAGNFIDPNGNGDIMSLFVLREIAKGKITHGGDPTALQAYCYVPDWARAAVMLAEKRDDLDTFADIPFPGHAFSAQDQRDEIQKVVGKPMTLKAFPWWMMTALSPFWPLAYEMREMRYLFAMSHRIGGERFMALLPDFRPTDLRAVMLAGLPAHVHPDKVMRADDRAVVAS
jgi:nucleoside-diphosphate-sugar epimerase